MKERLEPIEMTPIEQTPTGTAIQQYSFLYPLTDPMTPLDPTVPLADRLVVPDQSGRSSGGRSGGGRSGGHHTNQF